MRQKSIPGLTAFMGRSLSHPEVFFEGEEDWRDAIEVQNIGSEGETRKSHGENELHGHIYRRLGHITVNPHDEFNTAAIVDSYVYAEGEPQAVNADKSTIDGFVNDLINGAKDHRDLYMQVGRVPDAGGRSLEKKHYIVVGDRGTGKTYFLHYILSKYSKLLDDEKVIWVRLNLLSDFVNYENMDLQHWVYAKAAKIILRYYDHKQKLRLPSSPVPIPLLCEEEVLAAIDDNPIYSADKKQRFELVDKFTSMIGAFRDFEGAGLVNTNAIPKHLGQILMHLAIRKGYSFILAIDGLDRLDVTIQAKTKFDAIVSNINTVINDTEATEFLPVITSRTRTLADLRASNAVAPYMMEKAEIRQIGVPSLELIVDRRIEYLKDEVPRLASKEHWNVREFRSNILEFEAFLQRPYDVENREGTTHLAAIEERLGRDRRAQVQMVQLGYYDFLDETSAGKSYLLTEALLKAGRWYPPRYYSYTRKDDKGDQEIITHLMGPNSGRFDAKFLPVIFSFPHVVGEARQLVYGLNRHGMLLGIRMTQFILAHQELLQNKTNNYVDDLLGRELISLLHTLFDYDSDRAYLLLEEFAEFGLVELHGAIYALPSDPKSYRIVAMPKLRYLLSDFLSDIAYLNLSAMRTPLKPKPLTSKEIAGTRMRYPYIRAYSLDGAIARMKPEDKFPRIMRDWVSTKITNSAGLVRLINHINAIQKGQYETKRAILRNNARLSNIIHQAVSGTGQVRGMFDFVEDIIEAVEKQSSAIYFTTSPQERDAVLYRIQWYLEDWGEI